MTGLLFIASTKMAYSTTTINYGNLTLTAPWQTTSWGDVWDLTAGDLTLTYTIDQTHAGKIGEWDNIWTEVGLRGEGAENFNPGSGYGTPYWQAYQGHCGGWMSSGVGDVTPSPGQQTMHEKFNLQASGGSDELDYDCLVPTAVVGPFGTTVNYGIWFDRDTMDPYQMTYWGAVDGGTYNTGGIYHVVIHFHAIDSGLGTMFATVNGIQTGFYTAGWKNAPPDIYPTGLSFKGDMKHMQVFAGIWAPDATYGYIVITDLTVTGEEGFSDPLVPDFTYAIPIFAPPYTVHFTDATHGGMSPYSYSWDFNDDGITDSTLPNPTWDFLAQGDYVVKLTVTPYLCVTKSITKIINVAPPPVGGVWIPINKFELLAPWIGLASLITAATISIAYVKHRKK